MSNWSTKTQLALLPPPSAKMPPKARKGAADVPPNQKHLCLICSTNVGENVKAIGCSVCGLWTHLDCTELDDSDFVTIVKMKRLNGCHMFTCRACSQAHINLQSKVAALSKQLDDIQETMSDHEERISENTDNITKLAKDVEKVKETAEACASADNASDIVFKEMADREARKMNLVLYQVEEPSKTIKAGEARKQKDRETIENIFDTIDVELDIDKDMKYYVRTGEKNDDDKPRPLLLGFRDISKRDEVLNSAKNLAKSRFDHISIVPDLTKKQRNDDASLKKEMDRKNDEMDADEAKNWIWKLQGVRGQRRLLKVKRHQQKTRKRGREQNQMETSDSPPSQRRNTTDA